MLLNYRTELLVLKTGSSSLSCSILLPVQVVPPHLKLQREDESVETLPELQVLVNYSYIPFNLIFAVITNAILKNTHSMRSGGVMLL